MKEIKEQKINMREKRKLIRAMSDFFPQPKDIKAEDPDEFLDYLAKQQRKIKKK